MMSSAARTGLVEGGLQVSAGTRLEEDGTLAGEEWRQGIVSDKDHCSWLVLVLVLVLLDRSVELAS